MNKWVRKTKQKLASRERPSPPPPPPLLTPLLKPRHENKAESGKSRNENIIDWRKMTTESTLCKDERKLNKCRTNAARKEPELRRLSISAWNLNFPRDVDKRTVTITNPSRAIGKNANLFAL